MSPFSNSTIETSSSANGINNISTVSGPTVFWALLVIALNAMGQESISAQKLFNSGSMKEGLLMPWLSSPILCLTDIILDCYQIGYALCMVNEQPVRAVESTQNSSYLTENKTAILVRILLVIFGVIPQMVRLYAISGIPQAQIVATIYLATSLVRLLKTRLLTPASEKSRDENGAQSCSDFLMLLKTLTNIVLLSIHAIVYIAFWKAISLSLNIDRDSPLTKSFMEILQWAMVICKVVGYIGTLIWIVNILFDMNRGFQRYRPIYMLCFAFLLGIIDSWMTLILEKPSILHVPPVCPIDLCMVAAGIGAFLLAILIRLPQTSSGDNQEPSLDSNVQPGSANDGNINTESNKFEKLLLFLADGQRPGPTHDSGTRYVSAGVEKTATSTVEDFSHAEQQNPMFELIPYVLTSIWLFECDLGANPAEALLQNQNLALDRARLADPIIKCRAMAGACCGGFMRKLPNAMKSVIPGAAHDTVRSGQNRRRRLQPLYNLLFIAFLCCVQILIMTHTILGAVCDLGRLGPKARHIKPFFDKHIIANVDLAFAFFNLITAGVWYMCIFNGTGTSIPGW